MDDRNSAKAGTAVQVRLSGPLFAALEDWRRQQPKLFPRPQALRELLEQALARPQKPGVGGSRARTQ
jgi:hypothetical protein